MICVLSRQDGSPFATGWAKYLDRDLSQPASAERIYVTIALEGISTLALLDTGAVWSVVQTEIARVLGLLSQDGEPMKVRTHLGDFHGKLVRAAAELLAERGFSVQLESTVFVSEDWPLQTVVGYRGLLERVRFAVDPDERAFLFGALDNS